MKGLIEKLEAADLHEDSEGSEDLTEAERVQSAIVAKAADAMVNSPGAQRYLGKLPLTGYEIQIQQTIEAMLKQLLQMRGVGVSGGSQALRSIKALGRGTMP